MFEEEDRWVRGQFAYWRQFVLSCLSWFASESVITFGEKKTFRRVSVNDETTAQERKAQNSISPLFSTLSGDRLLLVGILLFIRFEFCRSGPVHPVRSRFCQQLAGLEIRSAFFYTSLWAKLEWKGYITGFWGNIWYSRDFKKMVVMEFFYLLKYCIANKKILSKNSF